MAAEKMPCFLKETLVILCQEYDLRWITVIMNLNSILFSGDKKSNEEKENKHVKQGSIVYESTSTNQAETEGYKHVARLDEGISTNQFETGKYTTQESFASPNFYHMI